MRCEDMFPFYFLSGINKYFIFLNKFDIFFIWLHLIILFYDSRFDGFNFFKRYLEITFIEKKRYFNALALKYVRYVWKS